MPVSPKLLYLLQTLLIKIPLSFFRNINRTYTRFIRCHKRTRLPYSTLTLPKQAGGLSLPDAARYYYACHLARAIEWGRHATWKQWVDIEHHLSPVPLVALPWCSRAVPLQVFQHLSGPHGVSVKKLSPWGWRIQCFENSSETVNIEFLTLYTNKGGPPLHDLPYLSEQGSGAKCSSHIFYTLFLKL